jgi:hypothetical protein
MKQADNKAFMILGLIKQTFISRDEAIMKQLYTTMVRPIVEYGITPRVQKFTDDIEKLE